MNTQSPAVAAESLLHLLCAGDEILMSPKKSGLLSTAALCFGFKVCSTIPGNSISSYSSDIVQFSLKGIQLVFIVLH